MTIGTFSNDIGRLCGRVFTSIATSVIHMATVCSKMHLMMSLSLNNNDFGNKTRFRSKRPLPDPVQDRGRREHNDKHGQHGQRKWAEWRAGRHCRFHALLCSNILLGEQFFYFSSERLLFGLLLVVFVFDALTMSFKFAINMTDLNNDFEMKLLQKSVS